MLTFVDPHDPAGDDPPRIRPQRRTYVPFQEPLPLNVRNLVKLAQAAPLWASCIAVSALKGKLWILGLFDQEVHHRNALNREDGDRFDRPGFFQIEIAGVGALAVFDDITLIATLNQNTLVHRFHDVLNFGPVSELLSRQSIKYLRHVKNMLKSDGIPVPNDLAFYVAEHLTRSIARILLSMKRAGHGGALLILPKLKKTDLSIKHGIRYSKLDSLIPEHVMNWYRNLVYEWAISRRKLQEVQDQMLEGIDIDLCNPFPFETSKAELSSMSLLESHDIESKKLAASVREEDAIKGELGGVAFVSGLAQLDGLVLMADGLVVHAFGVEITCTKEPPSILLATEESGTENPRALEYAHFGTRHRSMMRYCYANKGALGFVVSQDGDVRAMTRVGSSVIVWDRIKLQEIEPLLESLVSHEALPK